MTTTPNRTAPAIHSIETTSPCPWCGCEDVQIHTTEYLGIDQDGSPRIVRTVALGCCDCHARGAFAYSRADALAYWNSVAQAVIRARVGQTPNEATDREEHAAEQARMEYPAPDTARGGQ